MVKGGGDVVRLGLITMGNVVIRPAGFGQWTYSRIASWRIVFYDVCFTRVLKMSVIYNQILI